MTDQEEKKDGVAQGAFRESLVRNNKQIREDRAEAIFESAEMAYKREIEDLSMAIKQMKRERENMIDLSPTNAQSLTLASDFNAKVYVDKDIELGVKIREKEIMIEIAQQRYKYLFGAEV